MVTIRQILRYTDEIDNINHGYFDTRNKVGIGKVQSQLPNIGNKRDGNRPNECGQIR